MVWKYEKFKGDGAIYAFCPKCGFYHCPSSFNPQTMKCEISYQYNFCPMCGKHLYNSHFKDGVNVVWNERDIFERYNIEERK